MKKIAILTMLLVLASASTGFARMPKTPKMSNPAINASYALSSIGSIGLAQVLLGSDIDSDVAGVDESIVLFGTQLKTGLSGSFNVTALSESAVGKEALIELGKANGVDAIMVVTLRSVRMKENIATDNVQILVSAGVQIYETKTGTLVADFIHDRTGLNTSLANESANVAADIPIILKNLGVKTK